MQVNGWFSEAHDDTASITMGGWEPPEPGRPPRAGAALDLNIRFLPALSKEVFRTDFPQDDEGHYRRSRRAGSIRYLVKARSSSPAGDGEVG